MGASRHPVSDAIQEGKQGLYLNVHAQPGAKRPQLRGMHGDAVKIAVAEAPQDGKANAAIVRFVADALDIGMAHVDVASGHNSRRKRLFLHGQADVLLEKLQAWLDR
ncbi:MAG TPA: DUF167 domain-containing protein [Mariprofundaceae bacterium]|nr:DUF167 domain-containing protein [Mariprofundaceae bacterium]